MSLPRVTLVGPRLTLRPLVEADLVHGYRWERDQEVQHWAQGDRAPAGLTYEEYHARFAPPFGHPGTLEHFAMRAENGALIGFIGYFRVNREVASAEVGIVIGERAYWGTGYGREALSLLVRHLFTDLAMQRVSLETWSGNERAIRAYRAVGFSEEGRLRRAQVVDGRFYDTVLMSMLREECSV